MSIDNSVHIYYSYRVASVVKRQRPLSGHDLLAFFMLIIVHDLALLLYLYTLIWSWL